MNYIIKKFLKLNNNYRRSFLLIFDYFLFFFSYWITLFIISNKNLDIIISNQNWILYTSSILGVTLYLCTGIYKGLMQYITSKAIYRIIIRNIFLISFLILIGRILNLELPKFNIWVIYFFFLTTFMSSYRVILRDLIIIKNRSHRKLLNVCIYGAGSAGAQLSAAIRLENSYKILHFIDDNPELWDREIGGISIKSFQTLKNIKNNIDYVLLSLPSAKISERKKILENLTKLNIKVLQVPLIEELTSGKSRINSLKPINIEDLLGRDKVDSFYNLLNSNSLSGKNVCITGAGGSIGSELSLQILDLDVKNLFLIDQSENNLYELERKINISKKYKTNFEILMGNVCNRNFIENIFETRKIDTIFHAAAYKHVPLVEKNKLQALHNNVLSTKIICDSALKFNLDKVILISSDKAVRPTNLMGASKRLAELILLGFANEQKLKDGPICFSMVRFGNVLGSSGSVVPLFQDQLSKGGPITLTHNDIVRYFMTIHEAVDLVIHASNLAEGGEVFLLDMGKPIKIKSLAQKMISLNGLTIKNETNPNGDIEITYTGLRPGEKLYEELLIEPNAEKTSHPLIFKGKDKILRSEELWNNLDQLERYISHQDEKSCLEIVKKIVPEWTLAK